MRRRKYEREIVLHETGQALLDGFHGFFAVAARPNSGAARDVDCRNTDLPQPCVYQALVPRRATARVASDATPPTVTISRGDGGGCAGEATRVCLATPTAPVTVRARTRSRASSARAPAASVTRGRSPSPAGLDREVELTLPFDNGDVDVQAVVRTRPATSPAPTWRASTWTRRRPPNPGSRWKCPPARCKPTARTSRAGPGAVADGGGDRGRQPARRSLR